MLLLLLLRPHTSPTCAAHHRHHISVETPRRRRGRDVSRSRP